MGLADVLDWRGSDLVGIRNGIDTRSWDPSIDPHIAAPYSLDDLTGKLTCRSALLDELGWDDTGEPVIGIVSRLVDQKGMDLAFAAARYLDGMRMRMVVLGSGDRSLADWGRALAAEQPDRFHFTDGFDAAYSHRIFAGADLLAMPSRFEPCGLAQMQAMAYATIPVVTPVGGLVDTVVDDDASRGDGTGFVAATIDVTGLVDAAASSPAQPPPRTAPAGHRHPRHEPGLVLDCAGPAVRRPVRGHRAVSRVQRLAKRFSSAERFAEMERESRQWVMDCPCGATTSVWEMGGIRYEAASTGKVTTGRCATCDAKFRGPLRRLDE